MDYSIWTGVLLLSGAVGATMMFDRDPAEEDDPVQAQADLPHHPVAAPADPEHDIAADRDALAWFLDGTEGPGDLSTPHATEDEAAARPDDLVIPLDGSPDLPLIEGFQPGGHTLELVYTPATDPATGEALPPALSIAATEDGSSFQVADIGSVFFRGCCDLQREFAGRCQDQHARFCRSKANTFCPAGAC